MFSNLKHCWVQDTRKMRKYFIFLFLFLTLFYYSCQGCNTNRCLSNNQCILNDIPKAYINKLSRGYNYFAIELTSTHRFAYFRTPWVIVPVRYEGLSIINIPFMEGKVENVNLLERNTPLFIFHNMLDNHILEKTTMIIEKYVFSRHGRFQGFTYVKSVKKDNLLFAYVDGLIPGYSYRIECRLETTCYNPCLKGDLSYDYPVTFTFSLPATSIVYDTTIKYYRSGNEGSITLGEHFGEDGYIFGFYPINFFTEPQSKNFLGEDLVANYYLTHFFYFGSGSNTYPVAESTNVSLFSLFTKHFVDPNYDVFFYDLIKANDVLDYDWATRRDCNCTGWDSCIDDLQLIFNGSCEDEDYSSNFTKGITGNWYDEITTAVKSIRTTFIRKEKFYSKMKYIVFYGSTPVGVVFKNGTTLFIANEFIASEEQLCWYNFKGVDKDFESAMAGYDDWVTAGESYFVGVRYSSDKVKVIKFSKEVTEEGPWFKLKNSYVLNNISIVEGGITTYKNSKVLLLGTDGNLYVLDPASGSLTVVANSLGNFGKVRMIFKYHYLIVVSDPLFLLKEDGSSFELVDKVKFDFLKGVDRFWAEFRGGALVVSKFEPVYLSDIVSSFGKEYLSLVDNDIKMAQLDFAVLRITSNGASVEAVFSRLNKVYYIDKRTDQEMKMCDDYPMSYAETAYYPVFTFLDEDHVIFPGGFYTVLPSEVIAFVNNELKKDTGIDYHYLISHPEPLILKIGPIVKSY